MDLNMTILLYGIFLFVLGIFCGLALRFDLIQSIVGMFKLSMVTLLILGIWLFSGIAFGIFAGFKNPENYVASGLTMIIGFGVFFVYSSKE